LWIRKSRKPYAEIDREERRADRHEHVRAEPRLAIPQLALEADCASEDSGQRQPEESLFPGERRDHSVAFDASSRAPSPEG
jgi:hypothetical protein